MMNPFDGYRVTSPFGWRIHPISKERAFHTGIDIVVNHQDPIYAFTDGEVLFAAFGERGTGFGGYGNVVAIKDIDGHLQVYAHLDSTVVKVGAHVKKGQMIGRQGTTGNSTGSHLHYEVRKACAPSFGWISDRENNCYDPTKYLQDFYVKHQPKEEHEMAEAIVNECKVVLENGKKVDGILYNGRSYIMVNDHAAAVGAKTTWDAATHTVKVVK